MTAGMDAFLSPLPPPSSRRPDISTVQNALFMTANIRAVVDSRVISFRSPVCGTLKAAVDMYTSLFAVHGDSSGNCMFSMPFVWCQLPVPETVVLLLKIIHRSCC